MPASGECLTKSPIRIVAEIQTHIMERDKQNVVSRRYHAKDDKKTITVWRLDLDGILRIFNVCSVTSARRLLTSRFQTELQIDACATVSDTHQGAVDEHTITSDACCDGSNPEAIVPDVHDVSSARPIVSNVQDDIENTRTTASDIHRDKLKSRRNVDGQDQAVSITHTLIVTE